jgi:hypothetical protein
MAADASIRPLGRRAAQVVAHEPGSQPLLEIATEMNWIDDRVHIAAPVFAAGALARLSVVDAVFHDQ